MKKTAKILGLTAATTILACQIAWSAPANPLYEQIQVTETSCWHTLASLRTPQAKATLLTLKNTPTANFDNYQKALISWTLCQGADTLAVSDPATAGALRSTADNLTAEITGWLSSYGQTVETHGHREPAWLRSQPEAVSLAILTWCSLERAQPNPVRKDLINKFAQGIAQLHHRDSREYPFCGHVSFGPNRPLAPPYAPLLERVHSASLGSTTNANNEQLDTPPTEKVPDGPVYSEVGRAPGAQWNPHRSRQVQALVAAFEVTGDKSLLEEAQQETLGIWTHLAVSGKLPESMCPHPEGSGGFAAATVTCEQIGAVYQATKEPVYLALLEAAALWNRQLKAQNLTDQDCQHCFREVLGRFGLASTSKLNDVSPPVSYQVMQAEGGKAVQKAFDTIDLTYPGGSPGKFVRVGKDNMFWMRFDVDREDDYHFYMVFLKSKLESGLVSVLMRIDGDKIFTVPLGGASEAYVDMDFVDGPRRLRPGPHSFGIRFSGLLMTQPALLDSIIAWPVVERRHLELSPGQNRLLLHNRSNKPAPVLVPEVGQEATPKIWAVDGQGTSAKVTREFDRKRRRYFYMMPAGGTAVMEWSGSRPNSEGHKPNEVSQKNETTAND